MTSIVNINSTTGDPQRMATEEYTGLLIEIEGRQRARSLRNMLTVVECSTAYL